jgi:hypothetical protein
MLMQGCCARLTQLLLAAQHSRTMQKTHHATKQRSGPSTQRIKTKHALPFVPSTGIQPQHQSTEENYNPCKKSNTQQQSTHKCH